MFKVRAIVLTNFISEHGHFTKDQKITVTDEKVARGWLESNLIKLEKPGPAENKMAAGPSENKEGKLFGAPTTGRSTVTPSSIAPGPDLLSSASQADTSQTTKSPRLRRGGQQTNEESGESSQ